MENEKTQEQLTVDLKRTITEKYAELIELAKAGYEQKEIGRRLGITQAAVSIRMKKFGILASRKVKRLIKEKSEASNEEIAREANINLDAVERIREEMKTNVSKSHGRLKKQNEDRELKGQEKSGVVEIPIKNARTTTLEKPEKTSRPVRTSRPEKPKEVQKPEKEQTTMPIVASEEVIKRIRRELYNFPAIASIAKKLEVPKQLVIQVKEQMDKEQYDRTHTEKDFIIKRRELLSQVERNSDITDAGAILVTHKAEVLLTEFSKFMTTKEDYSLIAYAYLKARDYSKAIEIGEQYLGLETPGLEALKQKLQEITLKGEHEKTNVQKEQQTQATVRQKQQAKFMTNQLKEQEGQEH